MAPTTSIDQRVARLEQILVAQIEGHRRLMPLLDRKRDALRLADIERLTAACVDEQHITHRLGELEKHRLTLVGEITAAVEPDATAPLTVSRIAEVAGEPAGTTLLASAARLRELVEEARRQSSVLRRAAETLGRHIAGVRQTVHSALSQARVYGRAGRITTGDVVHSALDIRS
jgi:hypothetical protein